MKYVLLRYIAASLLLSPVVVFCYPLDGYEETGIRRVEGARLANEGVIKGSKQPAGALLSTEQVDLRLLNHPDMDLPVADPKFTREIKSLLGKEADRYGISVLDITNPDKPRYAEYRGDYRQNVGSIGKLIGALGLFQALADNWPDDLEKRREILKNTIVTADEFSVSDHHKVRDFNVETRELSRHVIHVGQQATLWNYLDWMLSVSSNSAAAMVMREAMLMRQYGKDYPPSEEEIQRFFKQTPRKELTALFQSTFFEPLTRNGLDLTQIRQGSFFTRQGKHLVNGGGNSYATSRSLMEFMLRMEQGRLVDEFSSRQLKRLLYMTERRIRYASSPALSEAAVYFKSGSLYSCKKEEGFSCGKYKGNRVNYMNSVAIVESPSQSRDLHYMVTLISNVLRVNSAVAHQSLGTWIQRMMEKYHAGEKTDPDTQASGERKNIK